MTRGAPVVEISNVRKHWPRRGFLPSRKSVEPDFLSNVTFSVGCGEIVVILGENGAGKTSLLKIVAGLARPDAGSVQIHAPVAYAGGERGFYFRLTARENLAFFGALDGLRGEQRVRRIAEVARVVDIEQHLDKRFGDLSSGMRQRLVFARALITDPDILLLDEPTRALDPLHAADLRRFIRETLAASGKTIIIATNILSEARELGDRIAVLRARNLEFVDLPDRAFDDVEMRELFGMTRHG